MPDISILKRQRPTAGAAIWQIKFNGTILQPLPIYSGSFMMIVVAVFCNVVMLASIVTNKVDQKHLVGYRWSTVYMTQNINDSTIYITAAEKNTASTCLYDQMMCFHYYQEV